MPKISVVVPVYKVEPYLRRCVDSILAQTFEDFQLILVDDGSPDNCGAICDEYAEKDSRVYVIHRENGGLSAARNSGIDWVFDGHMTEWITFVDSDDWVTLNYLEELITIAIIDKVNIAIGSSQHAHEGEIIDWFSYGEKNKYTPEEFWVIDCHLATVAWAKLYKTYLFENVRYPEGKLHEDELTTYKILFSQQLLSVSSAKIYVYYFSSSSIMRSDWSVKRLDAVQAYSDQLIFFYQNRYSNAYKVTKKLFVLSVLSNLRSINSSDSPKKYKRKLYSLLKNYLTSIHGCKLWGLSIFSHLWVKKEHIKLFLISRYKCVKKELKRGKQ